MSGVPRPSTAAGAAAVIHEMMRVIQNLTRNQQGMEEESLHHAGLQQDGRDQGAGSETMPKDKQKGPSLTKSTEDEGSTSRRSVRADDDEAATAIEPSFNRVTQHNEADANDETVAHDRKQRTEWSSEEGTRSWSVGAEGGKKAADRQDCDPKNAEEMISAGLGQRENTQQGVEMLMRTKKVSWQYGKRGMRAGEASKNWAEHTGHFARLHARHHARHCTTHSRHHLCHC